jgi:CDP-diacylglycerol--glycerol-3-phosphate 3-phosphatidyltransferase
MQASDKKLTVSNIITGSRLAMLPFIVYFLATNQRIIAFIIMLISLLSDAIDGLVARILHQESKLGEFLDPVCDKISLAVIVITLLLINAIPFWGVIIIVLRDILILIGSFVLLKNKAVIFRSNILGKITGAIFAVIILAFTLNLQNIGTIFLYLSIPAIISTFIVYTHRYLVTMKGEK